MRDPSSSRFLRTSLIALTLAVAACSDETAVKNAGDAGLTDQGTDAPGSDADAGEPDSADAGEPDSADTGADAADASGPDFSCLNVPLPTSVPDPVTITGQVSDEASPIAADLEVHRASDDSLIDSITTGTDGNYTLTVPTGGVPTAVYFRVTAPNHVETYRYFGYPLTADAKSGQRIWSLSALQAYAGNGGITPTAGKGIVYMVARDCALKIVGAGATYTTNPAPTKLAYDDGIQCEAPNLKATTSTDCTYGTSFDVEPGMLAIDAALGATSFRAQNVKVVADAMHWVTLQPDRP